MRKSLLQTGLLCGSLVILSGCYSNGKFHSPTWGDMAWWRKDKAPDTSLAAAPSVGGRPSDEALADKNSPGARATTAPPYDASNVSYDQPPAGGSRNGNYGYSNASSPNGDYPNTGYPSVPPAYGGGANWAANGDAAAASVASNPYAKSATGGYDTGSRYDGRSADHAQTTPYDSAYPHAKSGYGYSTNPAGGTAGNGSYSSNAEPSATGRSGYDMPAGPRDNPYYGSEGPASPTAAPRYEEDRYTSPDRYAPRDDSGASSDKYTPPGYNTTQDTARRYDAEGYRRDVTGDRYLDDGARSATATRPPAGDYGNARTADARNQDNSRGNGYQPGNTGYQPAGVPNYSMPTADGRPASQPAPYQPGGTSRYDGAGSSATGAGSAATPYGTNPYANPAPDNRYQDAPSARY